MKARGDRRSRTAVGVIPIAVLAGTALVLSGCTSERSPYDERLSVEAAETIGPAALLIDLRDLRERRQDGSPRGAIPIPYGFPDSFVSRVEEATGHDRAAEIVLICRAGIISRKAAAQLASRGFTNLTSIRDGFAGSGHGPGWKAWGLLLEQNDAKGEGLR